MVCLRGWWKEESEYLFSFWTLKGKRNVLVGEDEKRLYGC
jgi:hypothetical protein